LFLALPSDLKRKNDESPFEDIILHPDVIRTVLGSHGDPHFGASPDDHSIGGQKGIKIF
jgi:hypothetical protein